MKAIAVVPGKANSLHLRDIPAPRLEDVDGGRGVLVKVLRVGVDGTDRDINAGEYGAAPPGQDFLVLGHESFGVVEEVGPAVTELSPRDYVVANVRHPGDSPYDRIGMPDFTTSEVYLEHGISMLHGFLTEYYVDTPGCLVKVPGQLEPVGVLLEPASVAEKGIAQAFEIQRRLHIWEPRRAAVLGAGTIGLLATMILRLRGLDVVTMASTQPPNLKSQLLESVGASYLSTQQMSLADTSRQFGPFDIIFEASGFSPLAFGAMEALGKNGVLILSSVTGGNRKLEVPADAINMGFVLGNKVMVGTVNTNRRHLEEGLRHLALAEARWPGWLSRLLTHRVDGLERFEEVFRLLSEEHGAIKVVVEVESTR